ncbi:MAG TPA: nitroreductase [Firmicutes bacterium]|jgi:nitroreductase|nr:nitroreductase [Bacillota bacterium]
MDAFEAIHERRSVRRFKPDPVTREDIMQIVDAANWAPSAMNRQPWEFIAVSGEYLQKMGQSFKTVIEPHLKEWDDKPDDGSSLSREGFLQFAANYGNAPVVLVVLTKAEGEPRLHTADLESASAAMENLLLAATALGLGTCWMTGPLLDSEYLRRLLAIPDDKTIVALTPLGYPAVVPKAPKRFDPELTQKIRWVGNLPEFGGVKPDGA